MKVSAIVLTYNRAHMVKEAIDSILNQTFKDFELVIVDNYSSDNTESVVASYTDKRIRYFKNQNHGFMGVNRNFGIEKSGGEYIAFLDDDDIWLPEKLEKQVGLLDSNRELGLIYSDCYITDSNGNVTESTYFYGRKPVRGNAFDELLQYDPVPMPAATIRKEVLDRVGVFNPKYKIALDYDLWLRIAEHYPIDFMEQPLAEYRVHGDSGYQKNTVLAYREELQIMDCWLNKKIGGKRKLAGRIKRKKASLYQLIMAYCFVNHKRLDSFRESINLVRLLPYSLGVVPSVVAGLSRYLTRR